MPYMPILELMFIAVLAATLFYLLRLNRKLDTLRADREALQGLVARFGEATGQAERTMVAFRAAAAATGTALQDEINRAAALKDDLSYLAERADELAGRLETAVSAGRAVPPQSERPAPVAPPDLEGAIRPALLHALGRVR